MTAADGNRELEIPIKSASDIINARQEGRALAHRLGLSVPRVTLAATVVTELSENILNHSHGGEIILAAYGEDGRNGLSITARDGGPGIRNIDLVLKTGLSSSINKSYGLPGLRALADEFRIDSKPGHGTTVQVVLLGSL